MPIRVATYNIHHGRGLDGAVDLGRTADVLKQTGADLIALQELDRGVARSDRVDQPAMLQHMTGLRIHFFPTVELDDGDYGIAVATADDISPRFHPLPRRKNEERRGAIVVRWRSLSVIAGHLSRDAGARRRQTEALARLASDLEPPVVLLGDLNQTEGDLGPLRAAGFHAPRHRRPTVGRRWFGRQIDHVLCGPGLRLAGSWTLGRGASDHLALVAEIDRL